MDFARMFIEAEITRNSTSNNNGSSGTYKTAIYTIDAGTNAENNILTLATGELTNEGSSIKSEDEIYMASETVFNKDTFIVLVNGVEMLKGIDVTYSSQGKLGIGMKLDAGDIITIRDIQ